MLFLGRIPFLLTIAVCATSLCAALVLEHGFGVLGCEMCKYERLIILIGGGSALGCLFLPSGVRRYSLLLIGAIFFGGFVFSTYHVLIQQDVLALPAFCHPPEISPHLSLELVRVQLLKTPFVPCNKVTWSLFGLSLAAYSALLTGTLALYQLIAFKKADYEV